MRKTFNIFVVSVFCIALGMVGVTGAFARSADGLLSNAEVTKIVAQKVGSDVLSISLRTTRKGNYYYQVTVDNTPTDEVTDVFVNARTGKIVQIIAHPGEAVDGDDTVG